MDSYENEVPTEDHPTAKYAGYWAAGAIFGLIAIRLMFD